ncbi:hypothetical protein SALBM311S_04756 [Streptomyces alboniger]
MIASSFLGGWAVFTAGIVAALAVVVGTTLTARMTAREAGDTREAGDARAL